MVPGLLEPLFIEPEQVTVQAGNAAHRSRVVKE
jgi:hypothetical protein